MNCLVTLLLIWTWTTTMTMALAMCGEEKFAAGHHKHKRGREELEPIDESNTSSSSSNRQQRQEKRRKYYYEGASSSLASHLPPHHATEAAAGAGMAMMDVDDGPISNIHTQVGPIKDGIVLDITSLDFIKNPKFEQISHIPKVHGYNWLFGVYREANFLKWDLSAQMPDGFKGDYFITVEYRISILYSSPHWESAWEGSKQFYCVKGACNSTLQPTSHNRRKAI